MAATRRKAKSEEDEAPEEEPVEVLNEKREDANEDDDDNEHPPEASSSSGKKKKKSPRNQRKEQKEALRSKNLGLIKIPKGKDDETQKPKKTVFGDDDKDGGSGSETFHDARESLSPNQGDNNRKDAKEEDDDDDAVEQMDTITAKEMALAELERERDTKAAQAQKKKKKRKTKKIQEESDDDKDMLEETFFAELDAQKSARKKAKKAKPEEAVPKHTIFHSTEETLATPIEYNPGMELVVLEDEDESPDVNTILSLALTTEPSTNAIVGSRGLLVDGGDVISAKQKQKAKKGRRPPEPTWKRSTKMNRLLLTKGKGKAAVNFAATKVKTTYKF